MPTVKSMAGAIQYIKRQVAPVLGTAVKSVVLSYEVQAILDVVYAPYDPIVYERRGDLTAHIHGTVKGTTLAVENTTRPNSKPKDAGVTTDKDLAATIEYGGDGYDFRGDPAYYNARPFTATTAQMLQDDQAHVNALKKGLQARGLRVL